MFKKLVSTVFACALLVNAASAQTDAQVLAALSNMTNEELSQVAQDVKALVEADARAKGMNEEQVAAEVAKISTTVASLGTPQLGTLTKKESKIAYIVIGLASAGVLVLGYKFVWPWIKSKFSSDETKKALTEGKDAKKSKKDDKHKGHDHAKDGKKADDSKKAVADKADKAKAADKGKKAADKAPAKEKAPAKGKKAAAVSDDEASDDEDDVTVADEDTETEKETPAKARDARAKARSKKA